MAQKYVPNHYPDQKFAMPECIYNSHYGNRVPAMFTSFPLLISTGFLKYPLELKKKIQLVYTEFFFQFLLKETSVSL